MTSRCVYYSSYFLLSAFLLVSLRLSFPAQGCSATLKHVPSEGSLKLSSQHYNRTFSLFDVIPIDVYVSSHASRYRRPALRFRVVWSQLQAAAKKTSSSGKSAPLASSSVSCALYPSPCPLPLPCFSFFYLCVSRVPLFSASKPFLLLISLRVAISLLSDRNLFSSSFVPSTETSIGHRKKRKRRLSIRIRTVCCGLLLLCTN